jgi:hypothetical protein
VRRDLRVEEPRRYDSAATERWKSLKPSAVFRTAATIDILLSKRVTASAEGTFEINYIHYTCLKALPQKVL